MSLPQISSTWSQITPTKTKFNYTGLTYDDIINNVNSELEKSRFAGTTEAAFAKMILNIFAGMVDINNYNIERRAEESSFDNAKLKSSFISISRNLGYDVQRPVPAEGYFGITVAWASSGDLGNSVIIPELKYFSYDGRNFLNKSDLHFRINYANLSSSEQEAGEYTVTPEDLYTFVTTSATEPNQKVTFWDVENDIDYSRFTLIQGDFRYTKIFAGTEETNNQLGQRFQVYKINDTSFSDWYGELLDPNGIYTKVAIASSAAALTDVGAFTSANCYEIERRSLLKPELVNNYNFIDPTSSAALKVCLLRTAKDSTVDLKFGDGNYIAKGLTESDTAIFIKYLGTAGANANKSYVKDESITLSDSDVTFPSGLEISFKWYSNSISNGQDIESNESIGINAPAIYSALDRLVTRSDYEVYLRKLGYKNTLVWGEQEERKFFKSTSLTSEVIADVTRRLFNTILFSCTRSLYAAEDGTWELADISTVNDLDPAYDHTQPFTSSSRNIFNILMNQDYVTNALDEVPGNSALNTRVTDMVNRGIFTIKPVYLSPFIYDFDITGTVKVNGLTNISSLKQDIKNSLYAYLNDIHNFNSEVKVSNLTEIINGFTNVKYSDIKIVPNGTLQDTSFTTTNPTVFNITSAFLAKYNVDGYSNITSSDITLNGFSYSSAVPYGIYTVNLQKEELSVTKITMRTFVFELLKDISEVVTGSEFYTIASDLYSALSYTIRKNMLDSNGNISTEFDSNGKAILGGYSLGNELVRLNIDNLILKY